MSWQILWSNLWKNRRLKQEKQKKQKAKSRQRMIIPTLTIKGPTAYENKETHLQDRIGIPE